MNPIPQIQNRTIFHFNCPLCGSEPKEQRLEDFLTDWDCQTPHRLESLIALVFTAVRQVRNGDSRWLDDFFKRCADDLLERIRNGRDEKLFPALIHEEGYSSQLLCLVTCPLCQQEPGNRRSGGYFVRWNKACKVQTSNLCFEAALVVSGLLLAGHSSQTPEGIDLAETAAALMRTANATGLMRCPRCDRPTSCLYGPEKPYHLKGRCRWCLDAAGPARSVTLTADHLKTMLDKFPKSDSSS